ncbi:MAG TPA: CoA transferase [Mycobacteriales bacterium]|nr:CoA transferase [Mycobacteriales bacterium]
MTYRPLAGVRVIEVAAWTFVPAAGAVLAEWGADVIKIEHPLHGDPQRGLSAGGMVSTKGVDFMMEIPNRGKRSVGLDLASDEGRELLLRLVAGADVFLTNFLPAARRRLGLDVEDLRAVNPNLIYVRGSGNGVRGPDAERGGYDATSFWARTGIGAVVSRGDEYPRAQPIAFGDLAGAQTIAGGVAAALFARATTGEPSVVDVSLLSYGLWNISPHIVLAKINGVTGELPRPDRSKVSNPIVSAYKTKDDRTLQLVMLESDRYWSRLCEAFGRTELVSDPRFVDAKSRWENSAACVAELDAEFAARTLDECVGLLEDQEGPWAVYQLPIEVHDDPQVHANGMIRTVTSAGGADFELVCNPVQFDERPPTADRAPELGEHTEAVFLDLGLTWDELLALKDKAVIT